MPMCDGESLSKYRPPKKSKPETPWGIYWNGVMDLNRRFGGKESNIQRLYDFLDNSKENISAGFAESYVKLLEPNRSFAINLLKPLECESYSHFKKTKSPEETKKLKEDIEKMVLKTNGLFKTYEPMVMELEMDGYHRFDFEMKRDFPHRAFSAWLFDHPAPSWF